MAVDAGGVSELMSDNNGDSTDLSHTLANASIASLAAFARSAAHDQRWLEALRALDQIIRRDAATAEVWHDAGTALMQLAEYAQAINAFEQAVALGDARAKTHHQLARALFLVGQVDRALDHLDRATELTDELDPWQGMANLIPLGPQSTHEEVLAVRQEWARRLQLATARVPSSDDSTADEHTWTTLCQRRLDRIPLVADRLRGNLPLRIAYLSAHFAGRNYMKPVWSLINHHDRERHAIHLLSDQAISSPFAGYEPDARDTVCDVSRWSDLELAQWIDREQIDLLVDLSAFSYQPRLSFFLRKVAPVTLAWFNMFATSGLPAFDFIVGDAHVIRPAEEPFYSERVLRLPQSYLTFQVNYPVPDVAELPCLATGRFTFGSLVSQYKITPPVLDAWAEILRHCPDARLLLGNADLKSVHNRTYLEQRFQAQGVNPSQVDFLPPAEHDQFLRYYDQFDLALDAFPYNGGTTTMEAIWQGVPVLTQEGDRWAARTSQTLLRECHLHSFVARDAQDYVRTAIAWATQQDRWPHLATLRRTMRAELQASSVCNGAELARNMESLYRLALREITVSA